jgi:hypothetical protein
MDGTQSSETPLMPNYDAIQRAARNDQPMPYRGWHARTWSCAVVLTSATVFIASLTQIAFAIDHCGDCDGLRPVEPLYFHGWELLMIGLGGWLEGINVLVWPLVLAAWVLACCKRPVAAVIAVLVAVGLAVLGLVYVLPQEDRDTVLYDAWLANPIIAITWLLYLCDIRFAAMLSAVTAFGLTLSSLWVKYFPGPPIGVNVPDFEMQPIISYGTGYWPWVASAAIMAAGVSADTFLLRKKSHGERARDGTR